jgi:hypothetical protein
MTIPRQFFTPGQPAKIAIFKEEKINLAVDATSF